MPVTQGHPTWQIYSGSENGSKESYVIGGWNHVRIEVYDDSADVFINGRRSLRIPQLKASSRHGSIAIDATAARENATGQVFMPTSAIDRRPMRAPPTCRQQSSSRRRD